MPDYRLIGTNRTPKDLRAKITGRAKFAEDFRADGMLFTKLLLSPVPRGRVRRLDVSRALEMEGVHAVLTADDLPEEEGFGTEPVVTNFPHYQGQPIAAVAAVDETTAAEAIAAMVLEIDRLPFVLDPLDSLRPGGPNATEEGNTWIQGEGVEFKWTDAEYDLLHGDSFPENVEVTDEWEVGDLEAQLAASDLVIEEPLVFQSITHHPLEPRSSMAYWQGDRCFLHCSVQSTAQAKRAHARRLGIEEENLTVIAEYCGGGFGSKISGTVTDVIPALLARQAGRPVLMRVTRDEETYFGRARPGLQGWARIGFRADGRILALDMLMIQESGPYSRPGDFLSAGTHSSLAYQPVAQRQRGIAIRTNTPPKGAQRGPGGAQAMTLIGPLLDRGARELGVDLVDLIHLNAPPDRAAFGPNQDQVTSSFAREAVELGRERFRWDEKKQLSGQVNGSKVTGVGAALSPYSAGSTGFDGLLVIRPDGGVTIHSGVGNLGTHSVFDTAMAAAEALNHPWEEVEVVWGDSRRGLPWSSSQGGSQTTHAHTRANWATGLDAKRKLQEIAAMDLGGNPDQYDVGEGRVFRIGNPSMGLSFGQAATRAIELGGRYDGHELAESLDPMTVRAVQNNLVGEGLVAAATDEFGRDGQTRSTCVSFCMVEVDRETGEVDILEALTVADCGTVLNPRSLAAQVNGGWLQGMSMARFEKWSFDRQWGVNQNKRLYTAKPFSILDVPDTLDFAAVDIADPETPIGSKGIGEPPVGAGAASVLVAIADALGGVYIGRTPLTPDVILNALEGGDPGYTTLQTHV
jgi:CO/xanthine dehydrogenase Mo-binding subunit